MVAKPKSMQFFLKNNRDEASVLEVLSESLGFIVESADVKVDASVGFLQVEEFINGFSRGYLLSSPDSVAWHHSEQEVTRELALKLNTVVLLELTDEDDQWLLTLPTGEQKPVSIVEFEDGVDVGNPP